MKEVGIKNPKANLATHGLNSFNTAYWNTSVPELVEHTLAIGEGELTNTGALSIKTGEFTGRSPKDKFIVKDATTAESVNWGSINIPFDADKFDQLHKKICAYLADKNVYVQDASACADEKYSLKLRLIAEKPWSAMFANNMFIRHAAEALQNFDPEWTIICAPGFKADPSVDGTRQANFSLLDFSRKMILIGGSGYTGEIKKGIFTVLNFVLPHQRQVLSMHCSANVGQKDDTAVFFGLSGTGKTTLSADPNRSLIGDDEHGWSNDGVFNFEGGCYAKCVDLSEEKEPQIWKAIKFGAILENIGYFEGTRIPNYEDTSITENTRVSYPIHHIDNALSPSKGGIPQNIFFLTCDAFGVLPPISKLTTGQAMYHFISGYTAKVAGTEMGVTEPQSTFSACFGAAFLPLHPTKYAEMLGKLVKEHNVNVWLVNTGWTGGEYGTGHRMKLSYTRAMITACLKGELNDVPYETMPIFGLEIPTNCPGVPNEILNARNTWADKDAYDAKAQHLANSFVSNFEKYKSEANEEILAAAPNAAVSMK